MSIISFIKQISKEAKQFDSFLCVSAIIFAFLSNEPNVFRRPQNFYILCFQSLLGAFTKAFLAEVMSFLTWKVLLYSDASNGRKKWFVLTFLTLIHMLWIYITNLCFSCMFTKFETGIALLEFLVLIMMGCTIMKWTYICVCKMWSYLNEIPVAEQEQTSRLSTPRQPHTIAPQPAVYQHQPAVYQHPELFPHTISPRPILRHSNETERVVDHVMGHTCRMNHVSFKESTENGMPFCQQRTKIMDPSTDSEKPGRDIAVNQEVHKTLSKCIQSSQNKAPTTVKDRPREPSKEFLESKTRSGTVYSSNRRLFKQKKF